MIGGRSRKALARNSAGIALLAASCFALAQKQPPKPIEQSGSTVRKHRVAEVTDAVSPAVTQAEAALEKQDFPTAEKLLTEAVGKDPSDFRAWYDLAFVYHATKRDDLAVNAYQKTVALKPTLFEANLKLGQLLLLRKDPAHAQQYLQAATQLKPESNAKQNLADAWSALAQAKEESSPLDAIAAYRKAAELAPAPEPHVAAGALLEKQHDYPAAETEFKAALQAAPQSSEAVAGLINVYTAQKRLPEAEAALRELLKREPQNTAAHLQLGRVLLAENKKDDALAELQSAQKASPHDHDLALELARANAADKKYQEAADFYKAAVANPSATAQEFYEYGVVLGKAGHYADAQQQLINALERDPKMTNAYNELAAVASDGKNYPLVLKVLDARARLTPETPGTYFLRATAFDNMRVYKEAAQNYHRFLEVAQGKFPDQEWQARHRLIAIEPKKH